MMDKLIYFLQMSWYYFTQCLFSWPVKRLQKVPIVIVGQEFFQGKTIFIFKQPHAAQLLRQSAELAYANSDLLKIVSRHDLVNIVSTAIREKTHEELMRVLCNHKMRFFSPQGEWRVHQSTSTRRKHVIDISL